MRILAISDIHFPILLYNKDKKYIQKYFLKKKNSLLNLTNLITEQKIELVLIAGDVMGDTSSGSYSGVFSWLLDYFEEEKIYCFFITGNHDIDDSYNKIIDSIINYKYVKEISGKIIYHENIKILGLSYFHTENLTKLKPFILQNEKIDILLCHSQNKRIPILFDFNTRYIITGHFEMIFGEISNKILIAINYGYVAIIDTEKKNDTIKYFIPINFNDFYNSFYEPIIGKIRNGKITIPETHNEDYIYELKLLKLIKLEYDMFGEATETTKKIYSERRFRKISESTKLQFLGKSAYANLKD